MTDQLRKTAQDILNQWDLKDGYMETSTATYMEALRAALAETPEAMPRTCNPHPDAPHGFNRNASHSEDRYVCECEWWEPETRSIDALIAELDAVGVNNHMAIQAIIDKYRPRDKP